MVVGEESIEERKREAGYRSVPELSQKDDPASYVPRNQSGNGIMRSLLFFFPLHSSVSASATAGTVGFCACLRIPKLQAIEILPRAKSFVACLLKIEGARAKLS